MLSLSDMCSLLLEQLLEIFVHLKFLKRKRKPILTECLNTGPADYPKHLYHPLTFSKNHRILSNYASVDPHFLSQITAGDQPSLLSVSKPYRKLQKRLCSSLKKMQYHTSFFKVNDECYMEVIRY